MIGQPRSNQRSAFVTGLLSASLIAAAAGTAMAQDAASSLDPGADLSTQQLVISNWAGYMPEELPANFEAEFGTPVTVANHATNEEIVAKLTAGGDSGIDVAFVSGAVRPGARRAGAAGADRHTTSCPTSPTSTRRPTSSAYDPGNVFSVPYAWGTTGLCYRERPHRIRARQLVRPAEPEPRTSTGKTTMLCDRALADAARPRRHSATRPTPPTRPRWRAVKELLIEAKDRPCSAYDDTTFYSGSSSGEASLVEAWDGWCNYGIAENTRASSSSCPRRAATCGSDTMVVLKTSQEQGGGPRLHRLHPRARRSTPGSPRTSSTRCPTRPAMELVDREL